MSLTTQFTLVPTSGKSPLAIRTRADKSQTWLEYRRMESLHFRQTELTSPHILILADLISPIAKGDAYLDFDTRKIMHKTNDIPVEKGVKIIASSEKSITNLFISEHEVMEIVDFYNIHDHYPNWELEVDFNCEERVIGCKNCGCPYTVSTSGDGSVIFNKTAEPINVTGTDKNGNYPVEHKSKEWTENKVIDFVNWYIALNKLPTKYELENRTIIESFENGDDYKKWWTDDSPYAIQIYKAAHNMTIEEFSEWFHNNK